MSSNFDIQIDNVGPIAVVVHGIVERAGVPWVEWTCTRCDTFYATLAPRTGRIRLPAMHKCRATVHECDASPQKEVGSGV